jgi:hypothetical protein
MAKISDKLLALDESLAGEAWKSFFLTENIVVQFLKETPPEEVQSVLAAGAGWSGAGWDTTKAAKAVRLLTGVAMVTTNFKEYLNSFLFSLALCAGLEIPALELTDKASEVAFGLSEHWQAVGEGQVPPASQPPAKHFKPSEDEDDAEDAHLPWELPQVALEPELLKCLKRVGAGEKFPARSLLEEVPLYEGLKSKAEENNHGLDGRSQQDKMLKAWQQRMLNVARVLATLYPALKEAGSDYDVASQQLFYYVLETESQLLKERKRRSVPGAAAEVSNALFTQEDLKRDKQVWQLNQAGMLDGGKAWAPLTLYFRNPAGNKSFRFRGGSSFKGKGKSQSSWPSWKSGWRSQGSFGRGFGKGKAQGKWPAKCPRYCSRQGKFFGYCSPRLHCASRGGLSITSPSVFSHAENHSLRGVLGAHPPSIAPAEVFPLVGEACPTGSGTIDYARSAPGFSPPIPPVKEPPSQDRCRFGLGPKHFARLPNVGGSTIGDRSPQYKASGSLVHRIQARKWRFETPLHHRLSGVEPVFAAQGVQAGSPEHHLSLFEKGLGGCKSGPEGCIFSPQSVFHPFTVCEGTGGRSRMGVSECLFRPEHPSPTVHAVDENVGKDLEDQGSLCVCVPGRHFGVGPLRKTDGERSGFSGGHPFRSWVQNKHQKIHPVPLQTGAAFRHGTQFRQRGGGGTSSQVEGHPKGTRKTGDTPTLDLPKSGQYFGAGSKLSGGFAFLEAGDRSIASVQQFTPHQRLGPWSSHFSRISFTGAGARNFSSPRFRPQVSDNPFKEFTFRQFSGGLGGTRPLLRSHGPRFLEKETNPSHKLQGIGGGSCDSQKSGTTRGISEIVCGQHRCLQLPQKMGGQSSGVEFRFEAPLALVQRQGHRCLRGVGPLHRNEGRRHFQVGQGPGGLHFESSYFPPHATVFGFRNSAPGGHVCESGKCKTPLVLHKVAPLPSTFSGCSQVSPWNRGGSVRQPTLVSHFPMAAQVESEPTGGMPPGRSPLGFCHMVAPVNKVVKAKHKVSSISPSKRDVCQLLGGVFAKAQVAPSLSDCIRKLLEQQQVQPEDIDLYLAGLKSLKRYDLPFRKLWGLMALKGLSPDNPTVQGVATSLLALHRLAPNEARNAYSACLLLPGFQALRFSTLLGPMKKGWGKSNPKYASFWDASPVLEHLAGVQGPLTDLPIETLRSHLILVCRLLCLHRGIDLARTVRTVSFVGVRPFVLLQRKGWTHPRWEELLVLDSCPMLSPWHLMRVYVQRTRAMGSPGGPLLLSLHPPYKGLSSDTINGITKRFLATLGLDMAHWGAHSTRGAGVRLYKQRGLQPEEVCELGQWKNLQAFTQHYLRVGAPEKAAQVIQSWVHKTSPLRSAEHEGSRTPPKNEGGGGDPECEAQSKGEPTHPPLKRKAPPAVSRQVKKPKFVSEKIVPFVPPDIPLFRFASRSSTASGSPTPAPSSSKEHP